MGSRTRQWEQAAGLPELRNLDSAARLLLVRAAGSVRTWGVPLCSGRSDLPPWCAPQGPPVAYSAAYRAPGQAERWLLGPTGHPVCSPHPSCPGWGWNLGPQTSLPRVGYNLFIYFLACVLGEVAAKSAPTPSWSSLRVPPPPGLGVSAGTQVVFESVCGLVRGTGEGTSQWWEEWTVTHRCSAAAGTGLGERGQPALPCCPQVTTPLAHCFLPSDSGLHTPAL